MAFGYPKFFLLEDRVELWGGTGILFYSASQYGISPCQSPPKGIVLGLKIMIWMGVYPAASSLRETVLPRKSLELGLKAMDEGISDPSIL